MINEKTIMRKKIITEFLQGSLLTCGVLMGSVSVLADDTCSSECVPKTEYQRVADDLSTKENDLVKIVSGYQDCITTANRCLKNLMPPDSSGN